MKITLLFLLNFFWFFASVFAQTEQLKKKLEKALESSNQKEAARIAYFIADELRRFGQNKEAKNYYSQAVNYASQTKDYLFIAKSYVGLAALFQKYAGQRNDYYAKAAKAYAEGKNYAKAAEYASLIGLYEYNLDEKIRDTELAKQKLSEAADYYRKAGNSSDADKCQKWFNQLSKVNTINSPSKTHQQDNSSFDSLIDEIDFNKLFSETEKYDAGTSQNLMRQEELARTQKDLQENQKIAEEYKKQKERQALYFGVGLLAVVLLLVGAFLFSERKRSAELDEARKVAEYQEREALRLKSESDALLNNILPQQTIREFKEKGRVDAKKYDKVTILFSDFKGYTELSEKLTPHELVEELHYCFSHFDEICVKNNLEKIKTIGDAFMCAGGIPIENDSNPQDAVRAALQMRDFMQQYKMTRQSEGRPFFEARIGLNTGEVVTGVVGTRKYAYDLWGDSVNLASRMESSGEVGKVNISQFTYEFIKNDFECEYRGKVYAKGKGDVDMYFVNG